MTRDPLVFTCAFCAEPIPEGSDDLVTVSVEAPSSEALDVYFAHRDCMVRLLAEGIPPGEVLDGDV